MFLPTLKRSKQLPKYISGLRTFAGRPGRYIDVGVGGGAAHFFDNPNPVDTDPNADTCVLQACWSYLTGIPSEPIYDETGNFLIEFTEHAELVGSGYEKGLRGTAGEVIAQVTAVDPRLSFWRTDAGALGYGAAYCMCEVESGHPGTIVEWGGSDATPGGEGDDGAAEDRGWKLQGTQSLMARDPLGVGWYAWGGFDPYGYSAGNRKFLYISQGSTTVSPYHRKRTGWYRENQTQAQSYYTNSAEKGPTAHNQKLRVYGGGDQLTHHALRVMNANGTGSYSNGGYQDYGYWGFRSIPA